MADTVYVASLRVYRHLERLFVWRHKQDGYGLKVPGNDATLSQEFLANYLDDERDNKVHD